MILAGKTHASDIADTLRAEHFANAAHAEIFKAIVALIEDGAEPDLSTVASELRKRSKLEAVGGTDRLIEACQEVPSPTNGLAYADIVRELWTVRQVATKCDALKKLIAESDDANEIIASATRIGDVGFARSSSTVLLSDIRLSGEAKDLNGIPTGFSQIDKSVLSGGWPVGEFSMVMAREGNGKSLFMLQSLLNYCKDPFAKGTAAFVTLEMDPLALKRRLARMLCGVSRPHNLEEQDLLDRAEATIDSWDIRTYSRRNKFRARTTVEDVIGWLMDQHHRQPLAAFWVDYIQLLSTAEKCERDDLRQDLVARKLLDAAGAMGLAAIAASQVTLDEQGGYKSKGGNSPREHASLTIEIQMKKDPVDVLAKIGKNRHGLSHQVLRLNWNGTYVRFDECA